MRACCKSLAFLAALGCAYSSAVHAAPGDTLFYDNLNGNLNSWTVVANGGQANISNKTANQGRSLELRWGPVQIYTDPIAAAVPGAELTVWIRRGDDSFSEDPDNGEDLVIEYRNAANNWIEIDRYDGNGTPGEIYTPTYTLPAGALHANSSIRFQLTDGNGSDNDYWHLDDVRVTEVGGAGSPSFGPGSCDSFESGLGGWVIAASGGDAGTSTATANNGSNSLFTRWGVVSVTSLAIDLSAESGLSLDIWVQRGSDSFSENPEAGEDLIVEYFSSGGNWVALETFPGNGTQGETFTRSYALPAIAHHAAFSVRIRQTGGNGSDFDYWHADDVCLSAPADPTLFSLEETSWTGTPDEIIDSGSTALTGTAYGGATNNNATSAIAGNPGTCRYGEFDGVDDYIEIADNPVLDISDALTIGAWINMRTYPSGLHSIVSKDWNYEFHINAAGQVYWWWNDSSGATQSLTSAASITLNQWHHIAVVYQSGSQTIYVDGNVWATANYTGSLRLNDLPLFIGTDYDFISRAFDGYIDEVQIDARAYTQAEVQALRDSTHDCGVAAAEFSINHDAFGINCVAEAITVDVIDSVAGTPLTTYNASVRLDTQTGNGTWILLSGSGTLTDAVADDGIAVYDWPLNETQARFALSYPQGVPIFDIDVYQISDPGIRDTDAEGTIEFSASGFTLTAAALSNPPPGVIVPFAQAQTAAIPFGIHLTEYGQTPNDPVCGIIESYSGPKNLAFWSTYLNPGSGSRNVAIDGNGIAATEAASSAQVVNFVAGQASVSAKYKDVGSLQIAVKDETTVNPELPAGIRGATAGFVSRPARFELSDIENAAGTIVNPSAVDAFGPVFIGAGTNFRATVTALDAEGDATPNYGQEALAEGVRLDVNLVAPAGGASPNVGASVGFGAFSAGTATGTDFYWPEVGIIRLQPGIGDGNYLGAGDVVGDQSSNVGRFVPDHFALGLPNVPFLETQCGPGSFTYAGERFGYTIAPTISATAQAADNSLTQNYTGDFFKMTTASLANRIYTSASGLLDTSGLPPAGVDPAVTETGPGVATLVFSSGSGLVFDRTTMPAVFSADIELSIDVLDSDGIVAINNPATFGAGGGMSFTSGPEIRYGRLRFVNAVGSELVNLPVPFRAEYFAGPGIGFVPNLADSCTANIDLIFGGFTENLSAGETCALDSGMPGASGAGCAVAWPLAQQFAEPPLGGDFNLTLQAPGSNNHGSVRIDSNVPAWLRFDWDASSPGDENPTGTATFGLFDGEPAQIYLREIY
jgi:MSHA biogenesis protein MshQ